MDASVQLKRRGKKQEVEGEKDLGGREEKERKVDRTCREGSWGEGLEGGMVFAQKGDRR